MGNPIYPRALYTPSTRDGGAYIGGPPRGVWHETITPPSAFFTAETYYHIQFRQWPITDIPRIRQFIPFNRASRALRNLRPGENPTGDPDVQTNRMGEVNINAAMVGYQRPRANGFPSLYPLTDAMLNEILDYMEWCEAEWGIPLDASALISDPGRQEYGYEAPGRMSAAEWRSFTGWCGHELVTENTHHDPYYLFGQQVKAATQGETDMATKVAQPDWMPDAVLEELRKDGILTTTPTEEPYDVWRMYTFLYRANRGLKRKIAAVSAGAGATAAAVIAEIVDRLGG